MSRDLLPSPDILSAPPVPAAIGFGATNGHSAQVLTQYLNLDGFSDEAAFEEPKPVPALAQPQIAADMSWPSPMPERPAIAREMQSPARAVDTDQAAGIAAGIAQIQALLRPNGAPAVDVHFAVERIHDIAMSLRMREVDPALCEALEAAIREIGDAVVRHDVEASAAASAAALLRDVAARIDCLVGAATPAQPRDLSLDIQARPGGRAAIERLVDVGLAEADFGGGNFGGPNHMRASSATMPTVDAVTNPDAEETMPPMTAPAMTAPPTAEPTSVTVPSAELSASDDRPQSPGDPLAPIRALSDEELIALFS